MKKNKFLFLWLLWTIIGVALIYGISVQESEDNGISLIANVVSLAPLVGILLAMASTKAFAQFKNWLQKEKNALFWVAGGISFLFIFPQFLTGKFNPYNSVIFCCIVFAVLGTLQKAKQAEFVFTWMDLLLWILLWIPFDLRWYMKIAPVDTSTYAWWSTAISVIAVIGWAGFRSANIGFNLVPKAKDFYVVLLALLMIMVVVVPPGIITGFLSFSIPDSVNSSKLIWHFIGLFLTVALPEELFFRGLLLRGLEKVFSKKWISLVISSLAFGLMHWNNVHSLDMQLAYISLATIAGLGYGWAYRKSGNNLFAAILVHTLVDWIWSLILHT